MLNEVILMRTFKPYLLDLLEFDCSFVPANPKRTDVNKSKSSATYY